MFYVATLARYVLVEAENEEQARERGQAALEVLYAELRLRQAAEMPVVIRTVRPATTDEIDFCRWNEETVAREGLRWHTTDRLARTLPSRPRIGASCHGWTSRSARKSPQRVGRADEVASPPECLNAPADVRKLGCDGVNRAHGGRLSCRRSGC